MPSGNRLHELTVGGCLAAAMLLAAALSAGLQSDHVSKSIQHVIYSAPEHPIDDDAIANPTTKSIQRERSQVALTRGPIEAIAANSEHREKDKREIEDLAAQKRMADAAEWVVALTVLQTVIGFFGTLAVIGALIWTIRGTKSAIAQAAAADENNQLLRQSHLAEVRPWVDINAVPIGLSYNEAGLSLKIRYTVSNIGHSPASNVWIEAHLYAPAILLENFNPGAFQNDQLAAAKERQNMQLGSLVFPGKGFIQEHHLSISHDELKRITQKSDFLLLSVLAIVSYRFVFDGSIHHTALTLEIKKRDRNLVVCLKDGDLGAAELMLGDSIMASAYAD